MVLFQNWNGTENYILADRDGDEWECCHRQQILNVGDDIVKVRDFEEDSIKYYSIRHIMSIEIDLEPD